MTPPVFAWSGPEVLAYLGLGLLLGLGLTGSAMGLSIAGAAVTCTRAERRGQALAAAVLPGTQGLYAFAIGFLALQKLTGPGPEASYLLIFAAGLMTGIACLFSGLYQGQVCAAGIRSINQDRMGLGQVLLLAVFPEFYAILAFAFSALLLTR